MGTKGGKDTGVAEGAALALTSDLAPLGDVTARAMFGGRGVFCDGVMFALIDTVGTVHLRADDATAEPFEQRGSRRHSKMPYWQIPDDIRSDEPKLIEWATRALDTAKAAKR